MRASHFLAEYRCTDTDAFWGGLRMRLLVHAWREASRNPHLPKLNSDINFYIFEKGQSAVCISYGAFLMAVGNMMAGVFR